jgi:nitrite reductase/ring-hydroxylating ferredoxin subunit
MTAPAHALCHLDAIADPGAKGFTVTKDGGRLRVFVVRRGGRVFGYVNSCPHVGAPLNLEDDKFLDLFQTSILCANHFALFEMETGHCVRGPCTGRSLTPFPVTVVEGMVVAPGVLGTDFPAK